jgi:PAS domain S-box-containing protein
VASIFALVVGVLFIRSLRREITAETASAPVRADANMFPLETYHAVIQKLKQQDLELNELRRREKERARASESLSSAVLANLSSGVVLFDPRGLVQQANPAARAILGYASPVGLHARDVFAGVTRLQVEAHADAPVPQTLAEAVEGALRAGSICRDLRAGYTSPAGEEKILSVTVTPVGPVAQVLGAACLVGDITELVRLGEQLRWTPDTASGPAAGAELGRAAGAE